MPKSVRSKSKNNLHNKHRNIRTFAFKNKRHLSYVLILITVAIWGFATVVTRATISYVPPFTFLMIRFWISSLVVLPIAIYYLKTVNIDKKRLVKIAVAGLLGNFLALVFLFLGLARTGAIEGLIINSFSPLLVEVMGLFILHEIITKKEIKGTLIAFIGTLIIIFEPVLTGAANLNGDRVAFIGNILFFIGVSFDALYSIYVKKHLTKDKLITPFMLITFSFIFVTFLYTPLGIYEQYKMYQTDYALETCTVNEFDTATYTHTLTCDSYGCRVPDSTNYTCIQPVSDIEFTTYFVNNIAQYLSPLTLYGILYMVLFSGIVAYTFYNKGLQNIEASEASLFYYMQPLFGIPAAMVFLGESISSVFVVGAILIIMGIFVAERR